MIEITSFLMFSGFSLISDSEAKVPNPIKPTIVADVIIMPSAVGIVMSYSLIILICKLFIV